MLGRDNSGFSVDESNIVSLFNISCCHRESTRTGPLPESLDLVARNRSKSAEAARPGRCLRKWHWPT